MKHGKVIRILGVLLAAAVALGGMPLRASALSPMPRLEADAVILVDMTTGNVLYEHNADERHYPASLTKIMTCLLVLENLDPKTEIAVDAEAAATEGSTLGVQAGEVMDVENMLRGMMIPSGNDCAVALAKYVAGSTDGFAMMMNARAQELGCKNTSFVTPNGLHDEKHYTTARDLSKIALEAMKNADFREIVGTWEYTIPATNKSAERELRNTNLLLGDESDRYRIYVGNDLRYCRYEGTIGIKTGSTPEAGYCLAAACERDGTKLLSIVLHSSVLGRYADTQKLFDWGFENYKTYTVLHGGYSFGNVAVRHGEVNKVEAVLLTDVSYTLPMDASVEIMSAQAVLQEKLSAPVKKGDPVGVITLYEGDEPVGTFQAVAAKSVPEGGFLSYFGIEDAAAKHIWTVLLVLVILALLAAAAYVVLLRRKNRIIKARKAAKMKAKEREESQRRAEWERQYEASKYHGVYEPDEEE